MSKFLCKEEYKNLIAFVDSLKQFLEDQSEYPIKIGDELYDYVIAKSHLHFIRQCLDHCLMCDPLANKITPHLARDVKPDLHAVITESIDKILYICKTTEKKSVAIGIDVQLGDGERIEIQTYHGMPKSEPETS
jgi:hypothetical protein